MVTTWFDLACMWASVEGYLGWLPCLALHATHRHCQPTPESWQRIREHLAECGFVLPRVHYVSFGMLVQILDAVALAMLLRLDDATVPGPWWHGRIWPRTELRVAVQYRPQQPRRAWTSGVRGRPISRERLLTAFPGRAFETVLPLLQERGQDFHLHRLRACRRTEVDGVLEGMLIEVTSVYCVVLGFEVMLRATCAHAFGPEERDSYSSISDLCRGPLS